MSSDILGRVVGAACGNPLAVFLDERLLKPLKMVDSVIKILPKILGRMAQPLTIDPTTGLPNKMLDVTIEPGNASGGAGGVSTTADYMRFAMMMQRGGELDG